jgi:hypothetical protein
MEQMSDNDRNTIDLASLNRLVSITDLEKYHWRKCHKIASKTSTIINPEGEYHFIVVLNNTNEIVINEFKDLKTIPRHTDQILELYGLPLFLKQ